MLSGWLVIFRYDKREHTGGMAMMQKKDQAPEAKGLQDREQKTKKEQEKQKISPTWAEETIMDLDDFIESQGVYIRQ